MRASRIPQAVLAVLVAISLLLAACGPSAPTDQDDVRRAIQRYNDRLAEGYRTLNMNGMREVADQLQAEDEYIHMSSLAEGGVQLDPQLKDIRFLSVSVESTAAHAETRETWDYRHYARTTGKLVLEQKGLVYDLAWDLSKQADGAWLVTDVRAISATATVPPNIVGTVTPTPSQNP